jgi:hypothetical protein
MNLTVDAHFQSLAIILQKFVNKLLSAKKNLISKNPIIKQNRLQLFPIIHMVRTTFFGA